MWSPMSDIEKYSVENGDLLVCEGGEVGRAGILTKAPSSCIIQNALHRVRAKGNNNVRYLMYLLKGAGSSKWFDILCNKSTIAHFTGEKFDELTIALPSPAEQTAIAAFLDRETFQIDALIEKKKRQIELLKEKRSSLISHAVTKGLDPKAKMKDSGIEWLGEIPEGWEVKRLKRVTKFGYGDSLSADDRMPGDIPVYGSNGLVGVHDRPNTKNPCLVIGRKGSFGKINYSEQPCFAIDTTYYVDSTQTKHDIRWLYYVLQLLKLDSFSKDSAVPGLAREDAYMNLLPHCVTAEQTAIANHLDRETAKIDTLIDKVQTSIDLLREKRSALITAAVTGKIDVREKAA